VCVERRSSPNDGLRTLDAPEGTAAGGLRDMVPWAAARMLAYERPIRLSERLYITNECMHNWKQKASRPQQGIYRRAPVYIEGCAIMKGNLAHAIRRNLSVVPH
jgi:hypothetical protein